MCSEDNQNGVTLTVKEEPMETEDEEIKNSGSSSKQTGVNENSDDVPSASSTLHSNSTIDDGAKPSSLKSSEGGIGYLP